MKIHHAVAKKAAKHQITIAYDEEHKNYIASHADLVQAEVGSNATTALNAALKALGYKPSKKSGKKAKAKKAAIIANKSVVRQPYKDQYRTKGSGQGCGDRLDVAIRDALEGDEASLTKIAKANNIPYVWQALNRGLQRMNLSNVLRARVKRGESVDVLGKKIASL